MSLSKKLRFDVFKRDGFTCQYCGKSPPQITLEVDHVEPRSKGGSDDIDNLLTACFDCNRGKGAGTLTDVPLTISQKHALVAERELQLMELRKINAKARKRQDQDIDRIEAVFIKRFNATFTEKFRGDIRQMFLGKLDVDTLVDAAELAASRTDNPASACRYFCGVAWRKMRGEGSYP